MSYRDRLTIIIRIVGVYFLWQAVQVGLSFVIVIFFTPKTSSTSGFLDIFSGGANSIYILQSMGVLILVQGIGGLLLISKSKTVANWLAKDIPTTNSSLLPENKFESIVITLQIIGIVLFGITMKSFFSAIPTILIGSEFPFSSPIFLNYLGQILLATLLIFRAYSISKFIRRFSK